MRDDRHQHPVAALGFGLALLCAGCGGADEGVGIRIEGLSPAIDGVTRLSIDFHSSALSRSCTAIKDSAKGGGNYKGAPHADVDLSGGAKSTSRKVEGVPEGDYSVSVVGLAGTNPIAFGCTTTTIKTGEDSKLTLTLEAL